MARKLPEPFAVGYGRPNAHARRVADGSLRYLDASFSTSLVSVAGVDGLNPVDHGKLLRNAVDWAANEPRPVTVTGPGMLDVTMWRQTGSVTVHLVNLTNPMMMKGPLREFIPTPPQKVAIRLPGKAKKVQLLVSGQAPRVQEANGTVTLTIPSILDHEVVAIDL